MVLEIPSHPSSSASVRSSLFLTCSTPSLPSGSRTGISLPTATTRPGEDIHDDASALGDVAGLVVADGVQRAPDGLDRRVAVLVAHGVRGDEPVAAAGVYPVRK